MAVGILKVIDSVCEIVLPARRTRHDIEVEKLIGLFS
jgi:hypothetical protein